MDSLPLFHSWPLYEALAKLGFSPSSDVDPNFAARLKSTGTSEKTLAMQGVGVWACDLADEKLSWSPEVHQLFGLPEDEPVTRAFTASRYEAGSRRVMERLRAYAIEHRRGFTMDAMIRRADGDLRWMRLRAVPVLRDDKVVRLTGTKQDITAEYDGPGWRGF